MTTGPGASGTGAAQLAEFAAGLAFEAIPASAVERAKQCLIDAVACAAFGTRFEWSRIAMAQVGMKHSAGLLPVIEAEHPSRIRDTALAWGCLAHSFELDSLRKPGAGVHPGATVALPALATALALRSTGAELIRAIVAGCEVMFRIGAATLHTPEKTGFHAPGLTGPFGSAVACAVLMGLDAGQIRNSLGIAGSLGSGLLAFAKSSRGGMVKRLHLGRAAEGGVLAAQLAASGYEGPATILDGRFGLLDAYCDASDPSLLTGGLNETWEIETLCLKPFACHVTAQAPVELLRRLMKEAEFSGGDIAELRLGVGEKVLSHHASVTPADIMQAQYSVPFTTAVAAYRDLSDPRDYAPDVLADEAIAALAKRVDLGPRSDGVAKGWGAELRVDLRDGRSFQDAIDAFPGCPEQPMSDDALYRKFSTLVGDAAAADRAFDAIHRLESQPDLASIVGPPAP